MWRLLKATQCSKTSQKVGEKSWKNVWNSEPFPNENEPNFTPNFEHFFLESFEKNSKPFSIIAGKVGREVWNSKMFHQDLFQTFSKMFLSTGQCFPPPPFKSILTVPILEHLSYSLIRRNCKREKSVIFGFERILLILSVYWL